MSVKETVRQNLHHVIDEFVDNATQDELANFSADPVKSTLEKIAARQSMYKERFGFFYSTSSVTEKLGQSRQAVHKNVKSGKILRVQTREGQHVYPAFQFAGTAVLPDISRLVTILKKGGMDDWSILYWLTAPLPAFDNKTPADLALGNDDRFEQVVNHARVDAAHWVTINA